VKNAIDYIIEHYHNCENVVFADSARPFITPKSIDELFDLLNEYDAITTAQEITDSLGKGGNQFVERSDYFLIQKPAAFRFDVLRKHFRADSVCTAIIQQIPENYRKTCYFGLKQNMKITYPEDLVIAEAIMNNRE
jgi:2-C-methyl-D-erythritol 4-phosphate cytidylyltransferase